jgi:hypothetical protein
LSSILPFIKKDETKAEIVEYYNNREIIVKIFGKCKRKLNTIIMYELEKIHQSFNRLNYEIELPCNCSICFENENPHYFSFEVIQEFIEENQQYIQCLKSKKMVDCLTLREEVVDISKLNNFKFYNSQVIFAKDNSKISIGDPLENLNIDKLIKELVELKVKLVENEMYIEANEIKNAIEVSDKSKIIGFLKSAGGKVLQMAESISLEVASEAIKKSMGL